MLITQRRTQMAMCTSPGLRLTPQDVFKPEPTRLRRHLSAVVNFAKFREEKALAFQELQVCSGPS
jgi:hypothetical protein